MLKRDITYRNFDEVEVTKTYYFHISKAELAKIELEYGGSNGIETVFKELLAAKDAKAVIAMFERFILMSYGRRSADGESFIKTPELVEEFRHTAAYQQLFYELATSATAGAEFIAGIMPKEVQDKLPKDLTTLQLPTDERPHPLQTETDKRQHPGPQAVEGPVVHPKTPEELLEMDVRDLEKLIEDRTEVGTQVRHALIEMSNDQFKVIVKKFQGGNMPKVLTAMAFNRL